MTEAHGKAKVGLGFKLWLRAPHAPQEVNQQGPESESPITEKNAVPKSLLFLGN